MLATLRTKWAINRIKQDISIGNTAETQPMCQWVTYA